LSFPKSSSGRAKRLNDGVDAHQRTLDRVPVKRIAI
jgi:hypothetical protein